MQAGHPRTLADVDLFAPGAQEHWYAAYAILHEQSPVQRLPGEGLTPGTDAFVLTKYEDISRVVKDWDRFPPTLSLLVAHIQASGEMPSHIQAAVEPASRGFAVAIALFFNNLIGQALGLAVTGALSDALTPTQGPAALAIAVFAVCLAAGIASMAIFAWTARQMGPSGYLEKMRGG